MMRYFHLFKDYLPSLFFTFKICLNYKKVEDHEVTNKQKPLTNTSPELAHGFWIHHRQAFQEQCNSYFLKMI